MHFWAGCAHVLGFLHRAAFHQACTLYVTWVHKSAHDHEHLEFIFGLATGNVFILKFWMFGTICIDVRCRGGSSAGEW